MAALCHDIGHLPFSHAAEKLLPKSWDHEKISVEIIKSPEMRAIWESMTPPLHAEHIAKIAVGQKVLKQESFTDWEAILSEIIVGNAFGADRIDYLLRDSHHAGVEYGKFDHHRLLDTIRILPNPHPQSEEPVLGVQAGGVQSVQALLLARYFMYSQVYFHPVRRIYDNHLIDFLKKWLPGGVFPTSPEEIQNFTDIDATNAILEAAKNPSQPGHDPARRIVKREHFKLIYTRNSSDVRKYPDPGTAIANSLEKKYGKENVHRDKYPGKDDVTDVNVLGSDGRVTLESELFESIPMLVVDKVYINPQKEEDAKGWLKNEIDNILCEAPKEEDTHG